MDINIVGIITSDIVFIEARDRIMIVCKKQSLRNQNSSIWKHNSEMQFPHSMALVCRVTVVVDCQGHQFPTWQEASSKSPA